MKNKKNYVFVLVAKFAAGKTTIAKLLEERYGLKRAVTCTTRKKREGEREGIDYYYVNDSEFEELAASGNLVAINRIEDVHNKEKLINKCINLVKRKNVIKYTKKYGLPINKLDLNNHSYVVVLEPSGYYDLLKKLGKDKVKVIYLNLSDKERWLRALNREVNPDVDGIVSKYLEERDLYDGFEDISDKVVNNAGTSDSAAVEIYQYISSLK